MNYSEFKRVKTALESPPHSLQKFQPFFKSSLFLHFPMDADGRISSQQFYNYVLRKISLDQARIDLAKYDLDCDGFLSESDLNSYMTGKQTPIYFTIIDMMSLLTLDPPISPSFRKFYLCTAVRKFLFFLDKNRSGKVSITHMLLSPILTELFELRDADADDSTQGNWFSSHSALRVYGQFLNIDKNRNGLISRKEMDNYNNGTMSDIFLDRVFAECQTYKNKETGESELDYPGFLDFVLAIENNQTPEAIAYIFRFLDMHYQVFIRCARWLMHSQVYEKIRLFTCRDSLINLRFRYSCETFQPR